MFILTALFLLVISVNAFNSESINGEDVKAHRFITFNNDQSNIRLEMVFAIPFLQIPVGHSSGTSVRPSVDINLKSLVVAGMVFFLLFFIVPGLIRVTIPNSPISRGWEYSEAGKLLERMEQSLSKYGIDSSECLNEGVCYMLQSAKGKVKNGNASSWDKIIDGVSSNEWISPMLSGRLNYPINNCSTSYTCPIMDYNLTNMFTNALQNMKKLNFRLPNFNNINLG